MKNTILDMVEPLITTYTGHAHLLSVLGLNKDTYPWIFSNYIQIYSNKDLHKEAWADFYFPYPFELRTVDTCHWMATQKLLRNIVLDIWDNFVEAIMFFINKEMYLHVMVDQYYIPNTRYYNLNHNLHDIFIYGYNREEEKIYACDFIGTGKYSKFELGFDEINKAFLDYEKCVNFDYLYQNVYIYKVKSICNYQPDFMNILNTLTLYLNGTTPEYWTCYSDTTKNSRVYGMDCYKAYIDYVTKCFQLDEEINKALFYLLLDHKRIMTLRFKYLNQLGANYSSFIEKLSEIEDMAKTLLNLVLKYNIQKIQTGEIIKHLNKIETTEYEVLTDILKVPY